MASRTAYDSTAGEVLTSTNLDKHAGGWIGYAEITADSATYTTTLTDISGLSVAVTVNANRYIKITIDLTIESEAAGVGDCFIREGTTELKRFRYGGGDGLAQAHVHGEHILAAPSAGSHTYLVAAQRTTGTATHKVLADANADAGTDWGPAWILVEDLGSTT